MLSSLKNGVRSLQEQAQLLMEGRAVLPEYTPERVQTGDTMVLRNGVAVIVEGHEMNTRFTYYPASGVSSITLQAKKGYKILVLHMSLENRTDKALDMATMVTARVTNEEECDAQAMDAFFYRTKKGDFVGGGRFIEPGKSVEGCMLFVVPQSVESSGKQILVLLMISGEEIECLLSHDIPDQ